MADMHHYIIVEIVLALVFFMVVAGVVLDEDFRNVVLGAIENALNFILDHLFGNPRDYQIAKDSTVALTCAIDVTAKYSDSPTPASGTVFDGVDSCMGGKVTPSGSVIARTRQTGGPISGAVLGATNKITGGLFEPAGADQCGATDCGLIFKDVCTSEQRCLSSWGGWYCEDDPTCVESKDLATILGGDYTCFGEADHVCVVCEREADDIPKNCCGCTHDTLWPGVRYMYQKAAFPCAGGCFGRPGICVNANPEDCTEGDFVYSCAAEDPDAININDFHCNVIGFELQQDMEVDNGIIGDILDFGRHWIGATGQPKYIVYFETFPEYAEASWIYQGTDILLPAFAIGAVSNLGWGGIKVAASGLVNGGKYIFVKGATKDVQRKVYSTMFKARMVKEFGGTRASRMYLTSMIAKDLVGGEGTEIMAKEAQKKIYLDLMGKNTWKKYLPDIDTVGVNPGLTSDEVVSKITFTPALRKDLGYPMSDVTGYVIGRTDDTIIGGTGDLTEKEVKEMFLQHRPDVDAILSPTEIADMTNDLNLMRASIKAGTFYDAAARAAIRNKLMANNGLIYKHYFDDLEKTLAKTYAKETGVRYGIVAAARGFKRFLVGPSVEQYVDKEADEMAKMVYNRWMTEMWNEGGDVAEVLVFNGKTLPSTWYKSTSATPIDFDDIFQASTANGYGPAQSKLNAFVAGWNNLPADETIKRDIWDRSTMLAKGFTGMPYQGYPSKLRVAVMSTALAASYVAMQTDAQAEKYKICGQNSMCLAWPKYWFHVGNDAEDNSYEDHKIDNLGDKWVQMEIDEVVGSKGFPTALISPCKANIEVWNDKCSCKRYYDDESVGVAIQAYTATDMMDTITGDVTVRWKYDKLPFAWSEPTYITLPCQKGDGGLADCLALGLIAYDQGIDKYIGDGGPDSRLMKDITAHLTGGTYAMTYNPNHAWTPWTATEDIYSYFGADFKFLNIRYEKVKNDVFGDPDKEPDLVPKPYKTCVKYGAWDVASWLADNVETDCVKIKVDTASMGGYKAEGFEPNFCRDNTNQLEDKAAWGIEAGLFAGGIALVLFPPTSAAGAAAVIGVSGAAGGVGAVTIAWLGLIDKWPKDQS